MVRFAKYFFCLCCIIISYATRAQQDTLIEEAPKEEAPPVVMPAESYDSEATSGYYDKKEFKVADSTTKFSERHPDKEVVSRLHKDEAYWYANADLTPKKQEKKKNIVVEKTDWLNTLFWIILVGAFVALVVWLLSGSNINLFRRSPDEIETGDDIAQENIFEINFEREIEAAAASGNYRLGVRLMYLQVLRIMADRKIINYTAEKTNSDYLFQLASTKYYRDFSRLTRNFDYIWYGQFTLSPDSFSVLQKDFSSFKQTLV